MTNLNSILAPGMLVRHPDHPDWGTGQVQSNIGGKVTVNFRDAGKVVGGTGQQPAIADARSADVPCENVAW